MRALCLSDGQLTFRSDIPQPICAEGEALVRVCLAGICATDLELVKGYAGYQGILGHEFVGVVESCVEPAWIGRRVVGSINLGCGRCPTCLGDGPEHCPERTVLGIVNKDGVFAEHVTLPVANLLEVPDTVSDEMAVFTEPLAASLRIREQFIVDPATRIAVVGPGRLGLLVGQILALAGEEVVVLGRSQSSLDLPARLGLLTGLVDESADEGFDLVVEATGNVEGFAHALRLVRPLGTVVLKSTYAGSASLDLTKLVVAEIHVVGSRCGPFAPAMRLLEQEAVQVTPLIEAEYPLSDGQIAFEHAARPGVRKVLLRP